MKLGPFVTNSTMSSDGSIKATESISYYSNFDFSKSIMVYD